MQTFFYSPFGSDTVGQRNNPVLLLLLILKEIFKHPDATIEETSTTPGPFEWTMTGSSTQKLREHFSLLPHAFPGIEIPSLIPGTALKDLFTSIEPFIIACQTNENLLLFLLRHQKELAVKPLLDRICPEGLDEIKNRISAGFNKRGYYFRRWTHSSKTP